MDVIHVRRIDHDLSMLGHWPLDMPMERSLTSPQWGFQVIDYNEAS